VYQFKNYNLIIKEMTDSVTNIIDGFDKNLKEGGSLDNRSKKSNERRAYDTAPPPKSNNDG